MEKPLLIVDSRLSADHLIVTADDVQPESIDASIAAEEAMGAKIDALAPQVERTRKPPTRSPAS